MEVLRELGSGHGVFLLSEEMCFDEAGQRVDDRVLSLSVENCFLEEADDSIAVMARYVRTSIATARNR